MANHRELPTDADIEEQRRAVDELEAVEAGLARAPRWSAEAGRLEDLRARILRRLALWDERFADRAGEPAALHRTQPQAAAVGPGRLDADESHGRSRGGRSSAT